MLTNIFSNTKTKTFTIPADQQVNGNVESSIAVLVCGSVHGDIVTSSDVLIKATGAVHGKVSAVNAVIEGKVYGTISCREKVTVMPGARIEGEISGAEVQIEPGAVFVEKKEEPKAIVASPTQQDEKKEQPRQSQLNRDIAPDEKLSGVVDYRPAKAAPAERWF